MANCCTERFVNWFPMTDGFVTLNYSLRLPIIIKTLNIHSFIYCVYMEKTPVCAIVYEDVFGGLFQKISFKSSAICLQIVLYWNAHETTWSHTIVYSFNSTTNRYFNLYKYILLKFWIIHTHFNTAIYIRCSGIYDKKSLIRLSNDKKLFWMR